MSSKRHPTIAARCRNKQCRSQHAASAYPPGKHDVTCAACTETLTLSVDAALTERGTLETCPACAGREFFVRKDFPQRVGLMLVVAFGLIASVFYYQQNIVATFATLFSLVIIDAVIFLFVGRVSVCYRCRAEFRDVVYNPDHGKFDLATSEKYD